MRGILRKLFIAMPLLAFSMVAWAQGERDMATTLFSIDGKPVTVGEFVGLYKKNHQGDTDGFTKEKIEGYLGLFINFKLKVMEAESKKMDLAPGFAKELETYKEELRKPYVAGPGLLDKLVKEAYERLQWEVKASHILLAVKPDATPSDTLAAYNKIMDIRARAANGEPFDKLARDFSEDPSAKSNGGELGYFSALQMVFPFEEAAYSVKVGEVSRPVRTRFGYHIIKVEDKRPSRGEVEVSHILVKGTGEEARKTIDEVYGKLQQHADWNEMCRTYSQDPGTKDNGGRLRPFGPGALASAPKFEEVAFSLGMPGDISKPFQTAFGWHIIRLERKIPLPPFSEMEASLKRRVARDERMDISKLAMVAKRKKELHYEESRGTRERILALADSSLVRGNWEYKLEGDGKSQVLFTLDGQPFTLGAFVGFVRENQAPTSVTPAVYIKQLYDQFVEGSLSKMEDLKLQESNAEYRALVKEYREGILLFNIMEKEVWNKASEDTVGQREYYNEHVGSYAAGLRVEARVFSSDKKAVIDSAMARAMVGDTLTATNLEQFKSVTGFRAFEKGDHPAIDKINWAVGLHQVEADGMYYLVEVKSLVPPGNKRFEEARASVVSDYQDKLEKDWVAQLKHKYKVKVNPKGKRKAMMILTSKQ